MRPRLGPARRPRLRLGLALGSGLPWPGHRPLVSGASLFTTSLVKKYDSVLNRKMKELKFHDDDDSFSLVQPDGRWTKFRTT